MVEVKEMEEEGEGSEEEQEGDWGSEIERESGRGRKGVNIQLHSWYLEPDP